MIRSVIKSARTERDLIEHFANIALDKIEPADRFLRVADESFYLLAQSPFMVWSGNRKIASSAGFGIIRYLRPIAAT